MESNSDVYEKIGSDDEAIAKAWPWSINGELVYLINLVAMGFRTI